MGRRHYSIQPSATIKADNRPMSMVLYVTTTARMKESFRRRRAQCEGGKETTAMIMRVPWVACLCVLTLMSLPGCRARTSSVQAATNPDSASATSQRGTPGTAVVGLLAAVEGTLGQMYVQVNA